MSKSSKNVVGELINPRMMSEDRRQEIIEWHDTHYPIAEYNKRDEEEWFRVDDLIGENAYLRLELEKLKNAKGL